MLQWVGRKVAFLAANIFVMIVLHGNSRQWWPKIPYLSLRDESVGEHTRLLFNTLALVTLGQAAIGQLPRERWWPRLAILAGLPAALPGLIWLGPNLLQLRGQAAERYNLSMVPLLPLAGILIEEWLIHRQKRHPRVETSRRHPQPPSLR